MIVDRDYTEPVAIQSAAGPPGRLVRSRRRGKLRSHRHWMACHCRRHAVTAIGPIGIAHPSGATPAPRVRFAHPAMPRALQAAAHDSERARIDGKTRNRYLERRAEGRIRHPSSTTRNCGDDSRHAEQQQAARSAGVVEPSREQTSGKRRPSRRSRLRSPRERPGCRNARRASSRPTISDAKAATTIASVPTARALISMVNGPTLIPSLPEPRMAGHARSVSAFED